MCAQRLSGSALDILGRWMARDGVDGAVAGRWGASQSHVSLLFDVGVCLRLKGSGERTSNFIV